MKKIIILSGLLILLLIPKEIFAKEITISNENFEIVSQVEKYYKTTTNSKQLYYMNSINNTNTIEITKEDYESIQLDTINPLGNGSSETTYKKLTTSILSNGTAYKYKTVLTWKTFPKVRSYDVIGIGHYSNVKYNSALNFSQTYCLVDGGCRTLTTYYPKITSTGVGAAFKVPTGELSSLTQTLYFDVEKNVDVTINSQAAYGDYSHATETVTTTQAQDYSIGTSGIVFSNGIGNYYDNISPAMATWTGNW